MSRLLFLLHRYLGIAVCLLVAAWCISGIVMMYVGYPSFSPRERIATLPPLSWKKCCEFDRALASAGAEDLASFEIEMLADAPVLRAVATDGAEINVDLAAGKLITRISEDTAQLVAYDHVRHLKHIPWAPGIVERDQWTVSGAFNRDRPLYLVPLRDEAQTEIYISSRTGKIVQDTTRRERVWNWVGAVTHWLYPTVLRQHAAAWSQVVIWTSLVGIVLTITGLYLGVTRLDSRSGKLRSPYHGLTWWHHVLGLTFGVLTFTWLLSGLFSMSPWGLFEGEDAYQEEQRMTNIALDMRQAMDVARRLSEADASGVMHVASAPLNGELFLKVTSGDQVTRLSAQTLAPAPLAREKLAELAKNLQPEVQIASATWLTEPDAYYYSSHDYADGRPFPVLRVVLADEGKTRYYLDASDGAILQKADANVRWSRWLFEGLHRFDFSRAVRQRPLWDLIVVTLMLGVTAVALTGVYMGFRHLTRSRERAPS